MPIRVIRIMEYIYVNQEEFETDSARWFVPPMGSRTNLAGNTTIRSSMMLPESIANSELTKKD